MIRVSKRAMSPLQHSSNESGELRCSDPYRRPSRSASGRNGTDRLVGLGGVDVDRPRHEVAGQRQLHHVGDGVAGLVLSLAGRRPEVRRDDDLRQVEQRRLGGGLGVEHVERGTGDHAVADALCEIGLDHDAAAGDVDHAQRRLGLEQQIAIDQPGRVLGLGEVDREEVGVGDHLIERQQLDAHLARPVGRHERVVGDQSHLEGLGTIGDELADPAQTRRSRASCRRARRPPTSNAPSGRRSSAACACGTLRACASSNAIVCSAAEMMFDCGALTTITPRAVAASTSTLSSPIPARPTTIRSVPAASTSAVTWVAERMISASAPTIAAEQLLGRQIGLDVDGVAGRAETVETAFGDRFGDEDARHGVMLIGCGWAHQSA